MTQTTQTEVKCKLKDCDSKLYCLGFCRTHYTRFKRHGDTELHYGKVTRGMSKTRQFNIWGSMINRCTNPKNINYNLYSKRGVCKRWMKFINFWDDMKEGYSDKLTIERINNNKGYSKKNCRWATMYEQRRNTTKNRFYEYRGRRMIITDWEKELGFKRGILRGRIDVRGMSFEEAVTTPLRKTVPVKKICTKTNKVLKTYNSIKEAALKNNILSGNVWSCCNNRIKTSGGFFWRYV